MWYQPSPLPTGRGRDRGQGDDRRWIVYKLTGPPRQSLYNQPSRRCLGGTAVLEDNPVSEQDEDPVCEQENNCKNFVFRQCPEWPWGERKERCKLTVPPYIISVLDHKQELLESPVQDSLGNNSNLSPVLGKERGCKTLCLEIEKKYTYVGIYEFIF